MRVLSASKAPCLSAQIHWGRSHELVPQYIANHTVTGGAYSGPKCDLVHIDGDHSFPGVHGDFVNMFPMMHCDTVLLMDDVFDDEESGPTRLWRHLKANQVWDALCQGRFIPSIASPCQHI